MTPYFYSPTSFIGGGERYCNYIIKAASVAVAAQSRALAQAVMSFGARTQIGDDFIQIAGSPDNLRSIDMAALRRVVRGFDVVHVHQCLTASGLLAATLAREAGKVVVGTDHGGGEHHLLRTFPHVAEIYDSFHAQSEFALFAFADFAVPTLCIKGPVDDTVPLLPRQSNSQFAGNGIAAVGRFLPHKGYETIIDALDADGPSLVIAGQNYDPDYTAMLRNRAAGKPVFFRFDLSDAEVVELLANSRLYVHSSLHEDYRGGRHLKPELLGLAPLEALCQGTPALVSTAGSLKELADVLGCSCYRNSQELKASITKHFANPATLTREAIRKDCVAQYGTRAFGLKYIRFLDELA